MNTGEKISLTEGIGQFEPGETAGLRQCQTCQFDLRERDKFCRRCGAGQFDAATTTEPNRYVTAGQRPEQYATSFLHSSAKPQLVSGVLLTGIIASAQSSTSQLHSIFVRRFISTLIAVPLWLIIVLLSPFDAYITAKAISAQN